MQIDWKKKDSIRFYTTFPNSGLPFHALNAPIGLFVIYYGNDASIYTRPMGEVISAEYRRHVNGEVTLSRDVPISAGTEPKISIHGTGQVVGIERSVEEGESRAHLGFSLRDIDQPRLLAEHHIGKVGHYLGRLEESDPPKLSSVITPGVFETPMQPVYSIWAAPEDYSTQGHIWSGITKPLANGKRLVVSVGFELRHANGERREDHELRAFAAAP